MILVDRVKKCFGDDPVLDRVSLEIPTGQITGLIGPSGVGKSVLARCFIGLEMFDEGEITVDGIKIGPNMHKFDPKLTSVRRIVGVAFQADSLAPYRRVLDQIIEGPRYVLGLNKNEAIQCSTEWIENLGLSDCLNKYPGQISGGQLARVKLARSVVMNPQYLICDEVTANLDPVLTGEVSETLSKLADRGIGLLLISHQIEFLRSFAKELYFLHAGQVQCAGKAAEMLDNPQDEELRRFIRGIRKGQ